MKLRRLVFVLALGLLGATGCTLYNDNGDPYPGQYWPFV
jgi:hypothetical protein